MQVVCPFHSTHIHYMIWQLAKLLLMRWLTILAYLMTLKCRNGGALVGQERLPLEEHLWIMAGPWERLGVIVAERTLKDISACNSHSVWKQVGKEDGLGLSDLLQNVFHFRVGSSCASGTSGGNSGAGSSPNRTQSGGNGEYSWNKLQTSWTGS